MSDQDQDQALRKLWQRGQSPEIPESTRDALFADHDLAVEQALDSLGTHSRAAELVRAVSGLRGEAEQLARDVKLLRVPQRARRPARAHMRWAAAAAVVALAYWGGLPHDTSQPATKQTAAQPSAPADGGNANASDRDRIVSASFESEERASDGKEDIFGAGFDS